MAVYEQEGRKGDRYWVVDFKWVDPMTGKGRRIRRAVKDVKGRPAQSRTAAEQHENRLRTALAAGAGRARGSDVPTLADFKARYFRDHVSRLKASGRDYQERVWRTFLPSSARRPTAPEGLYGGLDAAYAADLLGELGGAADHGLELI